MINLIKEKQKLKPEFPTDEQVSEELHELAQAIESRNRRAIEEEMSDVFFMILGYCQRRNFTPEKLYQIAYRKTERRFPEELGLPPHRCVVCGKLLSYEERKNTFPNCEEHDAL